MARLPWARKQSADEVAVGEHDALGLPIVPLVKRIAARSISACRLDGRAASFASREEKVLGCVRRQREDRPGAAAHPLETSASFSSSQKRTRGVACPHEVDDLCGVQLVVDGHDDWPRPRAGKVRDGPLGAVFSRHRDLVSRPTPRERSLRATAATIREGLGIGEARRGRARRR